MHPSMKLGDSVFFPKPAKVNPRIGLFSVAAVYSEVRQVFFLNSPPPSPLC